MLKAKPMPAMPAEYTNLQKLNVPELRELCEKKGLSTDGGKNELVNRLWQDLSSGTGSSQSGPRGVTPLTPQSMDTKCDAIITASADIGDDESMIGDARRQLARVLEYEEIYVDRESRTTTIGNHGGLRLASLAGESEAVQQGLSALKAEFSAYKNVKEAEFSAYKNVKEAEFSAYQNMQEAENISLRTQVRGLSLALEPYKNIRHRFIETYIRDHCPDENKHNQHRIIDGNFAAHGGDAKADASLYTGIGGRSDHLIFKALYGYLPQVVSSIEHPATINLLNLHAGVKADKRRVGSPKFYTAFQGFVRAFKKSGFDPTYLDTEVSVVKDAFRNFHEFYKKEVEKVPQA